MYPEKRDEKRLKGPELWWMLLITFHLKPSSSEMLPDGQPETDASQIVGCFQKRCFVDVFILLCFVLFCFSTKDAPGQILLSKTSSCSDNLQILPLGIFEQSQSSNFPIADDRAGVLCEKKIRDTSIDDA